MFCHNCGKELLPEARFCDNCGVVVSPASGETAEYQAPVADEAGARTGNPPTGDWQAQLSGQTDVNAWKEQLASSQVDVSGWREQLAGTTPAAAAENDRQAPPEGNWQAPDTPAGDSWQAADAVPPYATGVVMSEQPGAWSAGAAMGMPPFAGNVMGAARAALAGVWAPAGGGETELAATAPAVPVVVIPEPLAAVAGAFRSIATAIPRLLKNPKAMIPAALMALFWIVVSYCRDKGIGGPAINLIMTNLAKLTGAGNTFNDFPQVFSNFFSQTAIVAALVNLATGGGSNALAGFSRLSGTSQAVLGEKSSLGWLACGAGAALLLYKIFVFHVNLGGTLVALAGVYFALTSLGRQGGSLYTIVQSITARRVKGFAAVADDARIQAMFTGLMIGFCLAIGLSAGWHNYLLPILGILLLVIGVILCQVLKPAMNEVPRI